MHCGRPISLFPKIDDIDRYDTLSAHVIYSNLLRQGSGRSYAFVRCDKDIQLKIPPQIRFSFGKSFHMDDNSKEMQDNISSPKDPLWRNPLFLAAILLLAILLLCLVIIRCLHCYRRVIWKTINRERILSFNPPPYSSDSSGVSADVLHVCPRCFIEIQPMYSAERMTGIDINVPPPVYKERS